MNAAPAVRLNVLPPKKIDTLRAYMAAGDWPEFKTSWARRLKGNDARPIVYLIARAI